MCPAEPGNSAHAKAGYGAGEGVLPPCAPPDTVMPLIKAQFEHLQLWRSQICCSQCWEPTQLPALVVDTKGSNAWFAL